MTSIDPARFAYVGTVASAARDWLAREPDKANERLRDMATTDYVHASLVLVDLLVDNLARATGRDPLALLDEITAQMIAEDNRDAWLVGGDDSADEDAAGGNDA